MITVRITGGLGNQMFQYAFARTLQSREKKVVFQWHGHRTKSRHNGFELDTVFAQPLSSKIPATNDHAWLNAIAWLQRKTARRREPSNVGFNPEFLETDSGYLDGYWQTEKYFKPLEETIRSDFTFKPLAGEKNLKLEKRVTAEPCTSIHIRRGDYLNHSGLGGICTSAYYEQAIERLRAEQPDSSFVIFSDDIPYCRELLSGLSAVFVDWNQGADSWMDMALMSKCTHHIIANSSFSWWGAWLKKCEGTVLCPRNWFATDSETQNLHICPDRWIRINNLEP